MDTVKKKILIVDDEDYICDTLAAGLDEQYDIVTVQSGLDAMTQLYNSDFDAVITDLNMLGLDGITLMKNILSNPKNKHIKFVVISGFLNKALVTELHENFENVKMLEKPFTLTEVRKTLSTIFHEHQIS